MKTKFALFILLAGFSSLIYLGCTKKSPETIATDQSFGSSGCLSCHLESQQKAATSYSQREPESECRQSLSMVYVSRDFLATQHGKMGCVACHRGNPNTTTQADAHVNLIANPSEQEVEKCGICHSSVVTLHVQSIHKTLDGFHQRIERRSGISIKNNPDLMKNFNKECGKCHASCGQCHVVRPLSSGDGFIKGHNFLNKSELPEIQKNCLLCHDSRVGAEFLGKNPGLKEDVHSKSESGCIACHRPAERFHGTGEKIDYRYDATDAPRCEYCHNDKAGANLYHIMHWNTTQPRKLTCQVCHSQDYKNCSSCHTGEASAPGSSFITFKIGKNYLKSDNRNYDYTTVRHIPIEPDTYASWGLSNLANFNAEPTWKYATPHNIQRWTQRTQVGSGAACFSNCHDSQYYLTEKDLQDFEKEANKNVVMGGN